MNRKIRVIYESTNEKSLKEAIENTAEIIKNNQTEEARDKNKVAI